MKEWLKTVKVEHAIAFYALSFCFGYLIFISTSHVSVERAQLISDIKIGVIGWGGLLLGYFFGASKSGDKKDEVIHRAAEKGIDQKNVE
ncbi:hypothetical protein [Chitinophaga sp. YIM B06452]|uniref:hypothetical protein n=1 Tax=Chitinophaga sp. YIM B06452 TaxID=3082158 RepID=UPI0031FE7FC3